MSNSGYGARIPDDDPERTQFSRRLFDVVVVALMNGSPGERLQAVLMLADEVPSWWLPGANTPAARVRLRNARKGNMFVLEGGADEGGSP